VLMPRDKFGYSKGSRRTILSLTTNDSISIDYMTSFYRIARSMAT